MGGSSPPTCDILRSFLVFLLQRCRRFHAESAVRLAPALTSTVTVLRYKLAALVVVQLERSMALEAAMPPIELQEGILTW